MNKIPCEVIRDLLPSYIDELTSETTNRVIREHLENCESCRTAYASMHTPENEPQQEIQERKEIDFLKKNKKRNRRIALGSITGAIVLIAAVLCLRVFIIGNSDERQWNAANLQVEGNYLSFDAVPTGSASAIADLTFTEADGVVSVQARSVLASPLHPGNCHGEFDAGGLIREVRIGDRIVWSEGATVSAQAADLFETRHEYVGDMPANQETANAMSMGTYLGVYTNELETEQEPYGWKIIMQGEISADKLAQKEKDMDAFGRVLVGLIGNLDHVTFVYNTDKGESARTITAADASEFLGEEIKNCGKNIRTLDALLQKSGLNLYVQVNPAQEAAGSELWLQIINQSDIEIQSFEYSCYKDGGLCSSGGGTNADNSSVNGGDSVWICLDEANYGDAWEGTSVMELGLTFITPDGSRIEIPERLRITGESGTVREFKLSGNAQEGYLLGQ